MIKTVGNNFVKFKRTDANLKELSRLLTLVEGYIFGKNKNAINCDYWGICAEGGEENAIVRLDQGLEGKPLKVEWSQIEKNFPELIELLDAMGLHYYIGKNYVANWGVHRHIYDTTSTMNLCMLIKGNTGGEVNFHAIDIDNPYMPMSDEHIFDLFDNDSGFATIIETVDVRDGDYFSFNTGVWHSHITEGYKAELFLLHFKDAVTPLDVEVFCAQLLD
jgi:hypothetical protein